MTQVFFYHGAADKVAAACALISKAYAQKKPVTVYAPEAEIAADLDRQLWTHAALSFVPHCFADSPLAAETPIVIACSPEQIPETERLMNLGKELPENLQRFKSFIEVVGLEDDDRQAARERVAHYKAQGIEVRYFDLSAPV